MGLSCSVTIGDLGLPIETPYYGLPIDYSEAFNVFGSIFLSTAQSLCPVRSGYLLSSINVNVSGDGVTCEAGAHYAQYVEYGTWKMGARPFMEPALSIALAASAGAFQEAYDMAMEEERAMLEEEIMSQLKGAIEEGIEGEEREEALNTLDFSSLEGFFSSLVSMLLIGLIMGIIQGFFNSLFSDPDRKAAIGDMVGSSSISMPFSITVF